MKKSLATISLVSVLALTVSACGMHNKGGGDGTFDPDNVPITTTTMELPKFDLSTLPRVDATDSFGEYRVGSFDEAWGADKNLRMAYTSVRNYFNYYSLDPYDNQINTNLNYISTISRPNVTVYPAEQDGYVVYEVKYSQVFPICTREPANISRSLFSYHGVSYIDFYTGATFPVVNLSTQIDSFCVEGDVIYEGKTYHVQYYEYRTQETLEGGGYSDQGDGTHIMTETLQINSTSYFVVPEGYDGILMCVYVADDSNTPIEEILSDDNPYLEDVGMFGDDENPDDYVFFGITPPK